MTDPERSHPSEPAEGDRDPGGDVDARTPHPEEPAEGAPGAAPGEGADTPGDA